MNPYLYVGTSVCPFSAKRKVCGHTNATYASDTLVLPKKILAPLPSHTQPPSVSRSTFMMAHCGHDISLELELKWHDSRERRPPRVSVSVHVPCRRNMMARGDKTTI